MRERVRGGWLTISAHAFQEMLDDDLLPSDLKHGILCGEIVERQRDEKWGEWKYVIASESADGKAIEIIAKLGPDDAVIITVYCLF